MHITIKCYATLAQYQPEEHDAYPIEEQETIESLLKRLGLETKEVKLAFVNGKIATFDTRLRHSDRVAIFPAVGGG